MAADDHIGRDIHTLGAIILLLEDQTAVQFARRANITGVKSVAAVRGTLKLHKTPQEQTVPTSNLHNLAIPDALLKD
jgi:hypothetical protein